MTFKPAHLDTTGDRDVVRRVLGNLKGIYLNRQEMDEALAVCDQLLLISRNSPGIFSTAPMCSNRWIAMPPRCRIWNTC